MRSASASASAMSCVQSRMSRRACARTSRMNSCTSSFERGSRPGRRLVEQEQHRRGQQRPRERDLLLHAAREVLHRLVAPVRREADLLEDLGDPVARLRRRHAVEAGRVGEVLRRGHLLEEARLDGDAVHEPADRPGVLERVVAEDARRRRRPRAAASRAGGPASTCPSRSGRGSRRTRRGAIVNVTSLECRQAPAARTRPALRSRRRNTFVRCSTSTAGTSRRTDVVRDVCANVDMLLLVKRNGYGEREAAANGGART